MNRSVAKSFSIICVLFLFVPVSTSRGSGGTGKIKEVDFKNFSYPWDDPEADSDNHTTWFWTQLPTESKVHLINGQHRFTAPDAPGAVSPALRFSFVVYGDLDGDGIDEAAVALNYTTGGTMNWDYLYVYKLAKGKPKLLGRLRSGSRGSGGLLRASINQGALVLDFADPDRTTADCCSDGYIRAHYRWLDGHFAEEGPREEGDLNGKLDIDHAGWRSLKVANGVRVFSWLALSPGKSMAISPARSAAPLSRQRTPKPRPAIS